MGDEIHLVEKSRIMDAAGMKRALSRLASEIVEKNHGADDLYLVGIRRRGVPLAERIVERIEKLEGARPLYGILDITLYRDDLSTVGANPIVNRTELDHDIEEKLSCLLTMSFIPDVRSAPRWTSSWILAGRVGSNLPF